VTNSHKWRDHLRDAAPDIAKVAVLLGGTADEVQARLQVNRDDFERQMHADGLTGEEIAVVLSEFDLGVEKHLLSLTSESNWPKT
jgi:hypothetical protein